jgi:hypothetical protein
MVGRCPALAGFCGLRSDIAPSPRNDIDPLVVDYPARLGQELGDLAIAIAAVLLGKLDNICSSSRPRGTLRCVERCCSETCSCARTCSMQARRRAGLRSFPGQPPAERAYLASDRKPPCAAGRVPDSVAMYQCLKTKDLQADIRLCSATTGDHIVK